MPMLAGVGASASDAVRRFADMRARTGTEDLPASPDVPPDVRSAADVIADPSPPVSLEDARKLEADAEDVPRVPRTDAAFLATKVHFERLCEGMKGRL